MIQLSIHHISLYSSNLLGTTIIIFIIETLLLCSLKYLSYMYVTILKNICDKHIIYKYINVALMYHRSSEMLPKKMFPRHRKNQGSVVAPAA